jgi:hypothetical protein
MFRESDRRTSRFNAEKLVLRGALEPQPAGNFLALDYERPNLEN